MPRRKRVVEAPEAQASEATIEAPETLAPEAPVETPEAPVEAPVEAPAGAPEAQAPETPVETPEVQTPEAKDDAPEMVMEALKPELEAPEAEHRVGNGRTYGPNDVQNDTMGKLLRKNDSLVEDPFSQKGHLEKEVKGISEREGFTLTRGKEAGARLMARRQQKFGGSDR